MATRKTKASSAKKAKKTTRKSTKTTKVAKKTTKKTSKSKASASRSRRKSPAAALTYEMIAQRAYLIWETTGCAPGHDEENWRLAEAQLKAELGLS